MNEKIAGRRNRIERFGKIFLAAPARKLPELMREQYDFLYSLTPVLDEAQEEQKTAVYEELDKLKCPAIYSIISCNRKKPKVTFEFS